MKTIRTIVLLGLFFIGSFQLYAQSPWIPQIVNNVSRDSLFATMADLQPMNRVNAANSMVPANYLKNRLQQYDVDTVFFHYFKASTPPNVVAIRYGIQHPNEYYVMGAHYDAVVPGAGADDNASGTAAVIEMARVSKDYNLDRSLIMILFAAEEVGLWGSTAFVDSAVNHFNMLGMINLDMIAYSHNNLDSAVSVGYRHLSSGLFNTYFNATTLYVPELQITTDSMSVVLYASDHAPFWQKNIPALFLIENLDFFGGAFNPYYHTFADTIGRGANSPWLAEKITRSAVATLLWLLNPTSPSGPLPVTLAAWNGAFTEQNTVQLSWRTASEYNNSYFEVQRDEGNDHFRTLGTIPGAGTSNVMQHYTFTDLQPMVPVSRYRLVQIDYDGSKTTSPVLEVQTYHRDLLSIQNLYYQHNQIQLVVHHPTEKPLLVELITTGGVPVSRTAHNEIGTSVQLTVNAPGSPGLYLVRVSDGVSSDIKRIVVTGR